MRLIDADAYLESIMPRGISDEMWKESEAYKSVQRMQTVDAVPVVHGRWKHKKDLKQFFCDQCGEPSLTEDDVYFYGMEFPNFCPNCGARMDGKGNGNETD